MALKRIEAPWTDDQVEALNRFQMADHFHPFTCPYNHGSKAERILHATPDGWVCPHVRCEYTQKWAHTFMLETWIGPPDWTCPKCGWREMKRNLPIPILCPNCNNPQEKG